MIMQFELSSALIDDILFSMEDQEGEFYVDTRDGTVAGGLDFDIDDEEDDYEESRYINLPEWEPSDGYRLMEHFAASFKNPLIQEALREALSQRRGVFRAFKDALGKYPEAEKAWFAYKEREMKKEIIGWYNALREEWGLEKIGSEPEETGDLVLEDFRFRKFKEEDLPAMQELHSFYEKKNSVSLSAPLKKTLLPGDLVFCAESNGNDFAGFASAVLQDNNYHIYCLEVKPEYSGLGIGETLLKRLLENIDSAQFSVSIDLPENAGNFSRVLLRENFKPCMTRYRLESGNG
ncbi:MAG: GNAT family N-acetyltransferase [Treponema sp.]|nr:GNAT family N-acetyltransferase [Treponema sp.]